MRFTSLDLRTIEDERRRRGPVSYQPYPSPTPSLPCALCVCSILRCPFRQEQKFTVFFLLLLHNLLFAFFLERDQKIRRTLSLSSASHVVVVVSVQLSRQVTRVLEFRVKVDRPCCSLALHFSCVFSIVTLGHWHCTLHSSLQLELYCLEEVVLSLVSSCQVFLRTSSV